MGHKKKSTMTVANTLSVEIKSKNRDINISEMVITGQNTNKTEVVITVALDDYFFSSMVGQMAKIASERIETAKNNLTDIENAIGEWVKK